MLGTLVWLKFFIDPIYTRGFQGKLAGADTGTRSGRWEVCCCWRAERGFGGNSRIKRWCMGRGVVTAECSSTSNAGSVTVLTKGEVGRASTGWSLKSNGDRAGAGDAEETQRPTTLGEMTFVAARSCSILSVSEESHRRRMCLKAIGSVQTGVGK